MEKFLAEQQRLIEAVSPTKRDSIGETVYTVILTDDRDKKWVAKITDARVLVQD